MPAEWNNCSDEELAKQSQDGSLAAFEELVSRYQHRLYAFACQCCPVEADAREVTQDAFVRAFLSIRNFDPRRAFAPWLFTIARRKSIDRHRSAVRWADEPPPEQTDPRDPAALLEERETRRNLWQLARRCLAATQFQALWLHYAEDMSVADIAQVLGKSRVHVKVMLFRARRTLAGELKRTQISAAPSAPSEPPVSGGPPLKSFGLLIL